MGQTWGLKYRYRFLEKIEWRRCGSKKNGLDAVICRRGDLNTVVMKK